jgi:hypothetical protein
VLHKYHELNRVYIFFLEKEDKTEPCFDTSTIHLLDFADWTKQSISLKNFLRFIGLQASAIHSEDTKVRMF